MSQDLKDKKTDSTELKELYTKLWGLVAKFLIASFIIIAPCVMIRLWCPFDTITNFFANLLDNYILPAFNIMFLLSVAAAFYVGIRANNMKNHEKDYKHKTILARNIFDMSNIKVNKGKFNKRYAPNNFSQRLGNNARALQFTAYSTMFDANVGPFGHENYRSLYQGKRFDDFNCTSYSITNPCCSVGYMGRANLSSYIHEK